MKEHIAYTIVAKPRPETLDVARYGHFTCTPMSLLESRLTHRKARWRFETAEGLKNFLLDYPNATT